LITQVMLGLPLTAAADVWSCGCVLMELILGQVWHFTPRRAAVHPSTRGSLPSS
jgi:hypothetical protein